MPQYLRLTAYILYRMAAVLGMTVLMFSNTMISSNMLEASRENGVAR